MARRKTSARTKLIGWGVLALGVLVIVGIFVLSRGNSPSAPDTMAAATTQPAAAASGAAAAPADNAPAAAPSAATSPSAPEAATSDATSSAEQAASSSDLVVVQPDAMDQGQRRDMLLALIAQGVFTAVQMETPPPKVGVTPLFKGLSPNLQQQFMATVYAYVNSGKPATDPLQVVDATTGKTIGTYTTADGLKLS